MSQFSHFEGFVENSMAGKSVVDLTWIKPRPVCVFYTGYMDDYNALKALLATVTGPRYTSYPTADRMTEAVDEGIWRNALAHRNQLQTLTPLSLYVHIPFCRSVCYYCACNKVVTKRQERSHPYLNALFTEIDTVADVLAHKPAVLQLHLGGGTPTYLSDAQLELLVLRLESRFPFHPHAERSIEVDPRTVDNERLSALRSMGFERLSLGVQDLNPATQHAVNRVQSLRQLSHLTDAARCLGYQSVNFDFILGLPHQTRETFWQTLQAAIALRPDRVALYAYAHLPDRFKPQRRIVADTLPSLDEKLAMQAMATALFVDAGYEHIGMDHFALPGDALAVAKRQGRLHRNFQGYTTAPEADVLGLGVSAISRVGAVTVQNEREVATYEERARDGHLPVMRGHVSSREDLLRQRVILALMCQGLVDFEAIQTEFLVDFRRHFAAELSRLQPFVEAGLLVSTADALELTARGWFVVRNIAMVFDAYLTADRMHTAYSRVL